MFHKSENFLKIYLTLIIIITYSINSNDNRYQINRGGKKMLQTINHVCIVVCENCSYMEQDQLSFEGCPCCGAEERIEWYEYIEMEEKKCALY
jgi:rubrerythrin